MQFGSSMAVATSNDLEEKFDLTSLVQVLDFFHRSVTVGVVVTITNYSDGSCFYVSPNFKDLTGHDPELFKEGGMNWLANHLHPEDREHFKINFTEGFLFLLNLAQDQKMKCYFNLSCRVMHKRGNPIWIYQQCRPIALDAQGKPLYSLNVIVDLTNVMPQDGQPCWSVVEPRTGAKPIFLGGSCGENMHWLFGTSASPFTKKESKVLELLMKGLSGKQLAAKLDVSINTINTHRKSIFRKTRAQSLNEAISRALKNNWVHE